MSHLEIIAVLLGLVNIGLLVRRSIWNYPFGIAMVTLYAWIFYTANLYSDALLQIFFLILQIYGWWNWSRAAGESADHLIPVQTLGAGQRAALIGGIVILCAGWGTMMATMTDAHYPYWDGSVAMISVAAQILLARRYLENWILWALVDIIAIPLYWVKDLHLTAGIYAVFLVMSLLGLAEWYRTWKAQQEITPSL